MKTIHAVGVIFENDQRQVLVLKRHPDKPEGGTWGLAGGKVEDGEDPIESAIREVKEEIGCTVESANLEFVKTYNWEYEGVSVTFETFRCRDSYEELDIKLDTDANTAYLWLPPDILYRRNDLMFGLYPILKDVYNLSLSTEPK